MDAEAILTQMDTLLFTRTGQRLNELQKTILAQVCQGLKYGEIAQYSGYTEGHVKDVGSQLWHLLSQHCGERITKTNCRVTLERYFQVTQQLRDNSSRTPLDLGETRCRTDFVGREPEVAHLNTLVQQGIPLIVILGEGGLGKTTLAQQYLQSQRFELVLELLMAKETAHIASAERVVEEWLKQDLGQEPGVEFGINLARLKRHLQTRSIGILIDNLEPALDQQGRLIAAHRGYVELFRVLADARVQSVTLVTSRDRLCESSLNVLHYRLPGLNQSAWEQFLACRGMTIHPQTLQKMHQAYGGNAKAMGILCGAIQEEQSSNMELYWRTNQANLLTTTDLKDLVESQVNRLQILDPQAYRLFCRLGCYRYQSIATISTLGLSSLLWDVPEEQHRSILQSLQNRSLVEYQRGEYWLHPVIRAEAIARLRASSEWEIVNRQAAEFWTASVSTIATTKDALQALEAYYHYVEIQDFQAAGRVILKSRNNQWQQFLPLGSTLYRMGLLQPVFTAITQVIQQSQLGPDLSELYNILGDLHWISGRVHEAIACQEKAIALAAQALTGFSDQTASHQVYYLKMLEVDALLSMGLYKIDLWELETAIALFQKVIDLTQNTRHHRWAEKAIVCLALVHSYSGLREMAVSLATAIDQVLLAEPLPEQIGRFAYFMQILGQTYVNLGDFKKAEALFSKTLNFAEIGYYTQIKARTLIGLAEIYRNRTRFEFALSNHVAAIELLDQIGAKCDLANAFLQLAITYQAMGEFRNSKLYFEKSLQLFTEMQAPQQIDRVKAAQIL